MTKMSSATTGRTMTPTLPLLRLGKTTSGEACMMRASMLRQAQGEVELGRCAAAELPRMW